MDCRGMVLLLFLCVSGIWAQNNDAQTECSLGVNDKADVVILLDGLKSIGSENVSKVRAFLEFLVTFFGRAGLDTIQIGLVQNARDPHPEFYLNTHRDLSAVVTAVQTFPYRGGSTDVGQAFTYIREEIYQTNRGARAYTPRILIFITDGRLGDGAQGSSRALRGYDDVEIFAVGVKDADRSELEVIVEIQPERHVYTGEDFEDFSKISTELIGSVCSSIKQKLGLVHPTSLRFSEVFSRSVKVSWDNDRPDVNAHVVRINQADSDSDSEPRLVSFPANQRTADITHLDPQTEYEISVYANYKTEWSLPETGILTTAEDSVRLLHGPSRCSGSLEVLMDQSWTSVCEEGFGRTEAEVVCKQLDCGPLSDLQGALFTDGRPVGRSFQCEGRKAELKDCESFEMRCSSAANLTCADDMLELHPYGCSGFLHQRVDGQWRPVMTVDPEPDVDFGSVVCGQISCGSVLLVVKADYSFGPFWWVDHQCVTRGSNFRDCLVQDSPLNQDKYWGLAVKCLDPDADPTISVLSDGVSQSHQQVLVLRGSAVSVTCSVQRYYKQSHFLLLSPTGNYTLPDVNLTAHFLFSGFSPAHIGNYTCLYHFTYLTKNYSIMSEVLYITPGVPDSELLLRAGLHFLILMISTTVLYIYCKGTRGQRCRQLF